MQSQASSPEAKLARKPSKRASDEVRLAVCVNTFQRPVGLERLLRSLARSTFANPPPRVEVVVVDNDADESARELCERARDWLPFDLHYVVEKRRGISQARNTALSVAMPMADFVAITDDDTEPEPGWLAELLRVQKLFRADVVTGPNPPRFLDEPPGWIAGGGFFEAARPATGIRVDKAATHNVLIRCDALERMDRLFDERLGLQGCEDTEFFRRMAEDGHTIVWADDAVVYNCIPSTRMNLRWLLLRVYRISNALGGAELRHVERITRSWVLANGVKCMARGLLHFALAVALRRGKVARVHALLKIASGAGWLTGLAGFRYREYARVHGT